MIEKQILEITLTSASLYDAAILQPHIKSHQQLLNDPWTSLRFFLKGYAYERQGRSPNYAAIAAAVIDAFKKKPFGTVAAKKIWDKFLEYHVKPGVNHKNNPLCPRNTSYDIYNKKKEKEETRTTNQKSAIELVRKLDQKCIVSFVKKLLEKNELKIAHDSLREINGVGPKIASFFLRDIAVIYKMFHLQKCELLQPIDKWVKFFVETLADKSPLTDTVCALYIVQNFPEPERANQGIWYFCAQIANSSEYNVKRSLAEPNFMETLTRHHLNQLIEAGKISQNLLNLYK